MKSDLHRILVINHSGHPGGAPISLRNLLSSSKRVFEDIEVDIVHLDRGMRVVEFDNLADNSYFPIHKNKLERIRTRLYWNFFGQTSYNVKLPQSVLQKVQSKQYTCILVNTVVGLPMVSDWLRYQVPVFCWVHELSNVCYEVFGDDADRLLSLPITYIACSGAVDDFLSKINPKRHSTILSECIEPEFFIDTPRCRKQAHEKLTVGMIGSVSKRKGYDIFLNVVAKSIEHGHHIRFKWIGYNSGDCTDDFMRMVDELGLGSHIELVSYQPSSIHQMPDLDVLLLTSREDPNPLVVIEALASGVVPIVQRGTGGAVSLADAAEGFLVDYEAVDQMASCLFRLSVDSEDLQRRSLAAQMYASKYLHPDSVVKSFRRIVIENDL